MSDGTIMMIIAIIGIAVGYLAGGMLRNESAHEEEGGDAPPQSPQFPPDAVHIWRDSQSKKLVMQIGKRVFRSGEDLPPTESKFLAGLITYLQRWIEVTPKTQPRTPTPAPAPPTPAPAPAAPVAPPQASPPPLVDMAAPSANKSIVEQIDDLLQERIANTPLRKRGLRLMESLDGGMRVMIGLETYYDIDSIPDEEVKTAIQEAVKAWERKS